MALQNNIIVPSGYDLSMLTEYKDFSKVILKTGKLVENSYIRVCNISGNKYLINFIVEFKENIINDLIYLKEYEFVPSVLENASDFIAQAYDYLKTLEEYKNAVDC